MVPVFPHNIRIRLAQLNFFFWLCPDVAKSLSCWLSQFRKKPTKLGYTGTPSRASRRQLWGTPWPTAAVSTKPVWWTTQPWRERRLLQLLRFEKKNLSVLKEYIELKFHLSMNFRQQVLAILCCL